ncbi:MAG: tRNA epoxyqueuosine(34) reductase QueG [Planctomycetes bacterium]|nr:tRNA epoxyqueuosine(34) reductase QueG [Planctomycetota bacterium]
MNPGDSSRYIKSTARKLGFDLCGIARAEPIGRADYFAAWLAHGSAGSMNYLHRNVAERTDPRRLLDGARSVVVVALLYNQSPPDQPRDPSAPRGRVAAYAWGDDYHEVVKKKLFALADQMHEDLPPPFETKVCVDTAPLLERELAAAAGVGWLAKNTMILHPQLGSFFFLGEIVTTLELTPDEPLEDHCGTCTACLDACPTDAFTAPHQMDASRCISYLTIEHRGSISKPFQEMMGDWVFGCDVCQDVCPFNRDAPHTREARFAVRNPGARPDLGRLLSWSSADHRRELRGSAIKRANPEMLLRNARIALDNVQQSQQP